MAEFAAEGSRMGVKLAVNDHGPAHALAEIHEEEIVAFRVRAQMAQCQRPNLLHQQHRCLELCAGQFRQACPFEPMEVGTEEDFSLRFIHDARHADQDSPQGTGDQLGSHASEFPLPGFGGGRRGEAPRPLIPQFDAHRQGGQGGVRDAEFHRQKAGAAIVQAQHLAGPSQTRRAAVLRGASAGPGWRVVAGAHFAQDAVVEQFADDLARGRLADAARLGEIGARGASQPPQEGDDGPLVGPSQAGRQGRCVHAKHRQKSGASLLCELC